MISAPTELLFGDIVESALKLSHSLLLRDGELELKFCEFVAMKSYYAIHHICTGFWSLWRLGQCVQLDQSLKCNHVLKQW